MIPEYQVLPDLDSSHNNLHRRLFALSFAILSEVATILPTTDTLPNMTGQFYDDGITGTKRLYVNLNNQLIYFEGKNT